MRFPPRKPVECGPRSMENSALWCACTWGPEPTPCDLDHWGCTLCRMVFLDQDAVRPQRCPVCDAEAVLITFRSVSRRAGDCWPEAGPRAEEVSHGHADHQ
jgi:hypothetical protein